MTDLGLFASLKSRVQRERFGTNEDFVMEFRSYSANMATQKPLKGRLATFIREVKQQGASRVK